MKRISSFILAFIISITCIFSAGISYADNRPHIEDALNNLQTQAGYIPFQNSSVQYNCFGFISDVCARLYSVTYYYEQQVGNSVLTTLQIISRYRRQHSPIQATLKL